MQKRTLPEPSAPVTRSRAKNARVVVAEVRPPPVPSPSEIGSRYFEWLLYAADVCQAAERARLYYFEVLVPERERRLGDMGDDEEKVVRASDPDEWRSSVALSVLNAGEDHDWEPRRLCLRCPATTGDWYRLLGTTHTLCSACYARLKEAPGTIRFEASDFE